MKIILSKLGWTEIIFIQRGRNKIVVKKGKVDLFEQVRKNKVSKKVLILSLVQKDHLGGTYCGSFALIENLLQEDFLSFFDVLLSARATPFARL